MTAKQPISQEVALLHQKVDQMYLVVVETRNDQKENIKSQQAQNTEVSRLLAVHNIEIDNIKNEVRSWRDKNAIFGIVSGALAGILSSLSQK